MSFPKDMGKAHSAFPAFLPKLIQPGGESF